MKLPKFTFSIGKYFSADRGIRPNLSSIAVRNGYIEATDSFKAIRVKTDIEGEFVINKENLINEETEVIEIGERNIKLKGVGLYEIPLMAIKFPQTESFYKVGENFVILDLKYLLDTLKCIKDIGAKKVQINIGTYLDPVIIQKTKEDNDNPDFQAIIMPLKY